jgi:excisionase family DNA binding protein
MGGVATLLTLRDVASDLGVSVKTVLGYVRRGELRALRGLGRGLGYRIKREWVEEFLRGREVRIATPIILGPAPEQKSSPRKPRRECPATFTSVRDARAHLGLVRGGKPS